MLAAVYNEKNDEFETITRIGTGFTEETMRTFKKLLEGSRSEEAREGVDALASRISGSSLSTS